MTREEAIKILSMYDVNGQWYDADGHPYDANTQANAFDMAIEALSADGVGRYENAMQKLREMPKYLNGVKEKQIKKISANEVVLCKDCRHRDLFSCPLADNDFQKDEDFCSWGERREP